MDRSRLSRRLKRRTEKTLLLSILGIILILFLLVKFGIPLLVNFSLLITGSKNDSETIPKNNSSFIMSPVLYPLFTATNSAKISISGEALPKQTVSLYLNDHMESKVKVKDDKTFLFEEIILSEGENIIKVKAADTNDKESDFSKPIIIVYKNTPPNLSIDSPSDDQGFSKEENTINVLGKTVPGAKVTVNNLWAIVDANGNYSKNIRLDNGENAINVVAVDEAGNKTEMKIKVNYSP